MQALSEIYKSYLHLTDKGSTHSYIEFYEALLLPYRMRSLDLLEIGVHLGGSLFLWHEYFPKARIFGVDVKPFECAPQIWPRIQFMHDNILSIKIQEPVRWDIVIDDGSHDWRDQAGTFFRLRKHLTDQALYIIEDIQQIGEQRAYFESLGFQIVDFRSKSGRYDDVLAIQSVPLFKPSPG